MKSALVNELMAVIGQHLAKQTEYVAALLRESGYSFPKEYDLGVSCLAANPDRFRVKARLNDVVVHRPSVDRSLRPEVSATVHRGGGVSSRSSNRG